MIILVIEKTNKSVGTRRKIKTPGIKMSEPDSMSEKTSLTAAKVKIARNKEVKDHVTIL